MKKCLQSVIDQDFTDYELIISDDTPGDEVKDFVHHFLAGRKFTYYKNAPALGSPANWNHAVSKATGTYIKLLHHDDFFTRPDSLTHMVDTIRDKGSDFVFCATNVWFPATGFHRIHQVTDTQVMRMKDGIDFLFFRNCIGSPSATLYKRDSAMAFDENLIWLVDVDFYIQYIKKHPRISCIHTPLVSTAHETENQITGRVIKDRAIQVREHVLVFDKIKAMIRDEKPYRVFFDYLLRDYKVSNYEELVSMAPPAARHEAFFKAVFAGLHEQVFYKRLLRKLYSLPLNKRFFKSEQY